ncbi:S-layer homology domain-containing protein [Patescibacteria group bacterium]|nr:S-layer homology domain-containing protein [Patescibacteria group bacterium]
MNKRNSSLLEKFSSKKRKNNIKNFSIWGFLLIFMSFSIFLVEQNTVNFQTSVLSTQKAPAFDGTISPIKKSPNYTALTTAERSMTYSQLPAGKMENPPLYNPQNLRISFDNLVWGNAAQDSIRNQKILYSVPYMGNYKLDGQEYAGNHLAIDIKIPTGTPIYAIGNGVVVKTSELLSGFGKHIVIEHQNFPSYSNSNIKETLYSSYSHLSSVNVTNGSIVRKGDIIGYSGSTGSSTTPHLHFQIDNDNAPWHPYWPFTSKEASDAGLTFNEAVNAGLNQDIAIANTVNPMLYVQKYGNGTVSTSNDAEITTTTTTPTSNTTSTSSSTNTSSSTSENIDTTEDTSINTSTNTSSLEITAEDYEDDGPTRESDNPQNEYVTFEIKTDSTYIPGEEQKIIIKAVDRHGNTITNYAPENAVRIDIMQGSALITPRRLLTRDFQNGIAVSVMAPRDSNPIQFAIKTDNVIKESPVIYPGIFADISSAHPHFQAIKFLKNEGVIEGYPDGSFKPENSVSRVEVLKFILEGIEADVSSAPAKLKFSDVEASQWYGGYLYTATTLGIVDGYPDGSFKPLDKVNKAEFLKMLIEAMNIDVDPEIGELPFLDVGENQWYAKYAQFAYEKNIIDTDDNRFWPNKQMTREEVAEAMYRVSILNATGASTFTADLIPTTDNAA